MEFGTNKRDLFYYTVPFYSISSSYSSSFASLLYWVYFCFSLFYLFLLFTSSFFIHVFLAVTGRIYSCPYVIRGCFIFNKDWIFRVFLKERSEKWMVGQKGKAIGTLIRVHPKDPRNQNGR